MGGKKTNFYMSITMEIVDGKYKEPEEISYDLRKAHLNLVERFLDNCNPQHNIEMNILFRDDKNQFVTNKMTLDYNTFIELLKKQFKKEAK